MAIGTITVIEKARAPGPVRHDVISFAGDASYPTGGFPTFGALAFAAIGVKGYKVLNVIPVNCGGYELAYDRTNDKLLVRYSDANNAADAPDVEVPAATNLSAVTFEVMVISH